jgi:hypothetical protein
MKRYKLVIALLIILLAVYTAFFQNAPSSRAAEEKDAHLFSSERAMEHVAAISKFPHAVGFPAHHQVREYIIAQLEDLGLEPELQEGYTTGDKGNFSKAENILARIKGSGNGKALMLLSHYDSSPHSSPGASDAASGVATILEGVRAFLSEDKTPENDIIILLTDAEELGLNGAELFVNNHPWAAAVGLVLNFESRGSGGSSIMLVETNRGNSRLIDEFSRASPRYPVGNSLAYSVYKMLPNDTDLTVFREDGDIQGFNFAFIDDHFDYHTALDSSTRLDRSSLAHQGSYLMPLLLHFSEVDLSGLTSEEDKVYFNVPFFQFIAYPYAWIWPMLMVAFGGFLILLVFGLRNNRLRWDGMVKGFTPAFLVVLINGLVGYFCWGVILAIYPSYGEVLQGFTYNGHTYIAALVFLSLAVCFWTYGSFSKIPLPDLLVVPLFMWLLLCTTIAAYLPGASYFIFPVFGLLGAFLVMVNQKQPNLYVLVFLGVPALWLLSPLVKLFPVGLGLKMLITTTLLTTLIFLLLLPVLGYFRSRWQLGTLCFLLFLGFMAGAHFSSGYGEENPRPTSLLYILDADHSEAQWATYDRQLTDWNAPFVSVEKDPDTSLTDKSLSSKYGTPFTYATQTAVKSVNAPLVQIFRDTVIGGQRNLGLRILPQRKVNRLEVFTEGSPVLGATVNGIELPRKYLSGRKGSRLFTHFITDNDPTELSLRIATDEALELTLLEASNDLLSHPLFEVPARPADQIPKPFVLNDAILVKKTIRFE